MVPKSHSGKSGHRSFDCKARFATAPTFKPAVRVRMPNVCFVRDPALRTVCIERPLRCAFVDLFANAAKVGFPRVSADGTKISNPTIVVLPKPRHESVFAVMPGSVTRDAAYGHTPKMFAAAIPKTSAGQTPVSSSPSHQRRLGRGRASLPRHPA